MEEREIIKLKNMIVFQLKTIFDPEIPVNIYDLGLIYDIKIDEKNNAFVLMTLTTPACPVADSLIMEVNNKVAAMTEINDVHVELTFDPPWDHSKISDAAKLDMGLL